MGTRRIGVTGHQRLSADTEVAVRAAIREIVREGPDVVGYTSLAAGADQMFAEEVLDAGGTVVAVVPSGDYETTFADDAAVRHYRGLLDRCGEQIRLPFDDASEEAYWAAGQEVVARCDVLLAVWDGKPAAGLGGTGDVVGHAGRVGREVVVVWPPGSRRG